MNMRLFNQFEQIRASQQITIDLNPANATQQTEANVLFNKVRHIADVLPPFKVSIPAKNKWDDTETLINNMYGDIAVSVINSLDRRVFQTVIELNAAYVEAVSDATRFSLEVIAKSLNRCSYADNSSNNDLAKEKVALCKAKLMELQPQHHITPTTTKLNMYFRFGRASKAQDHIYPSIVCMKPRIDEETGILTAESPVSFMSSGP